MATQNTLTLEYNGLEKRLGDWGFDLSSPSLGVANMADDVLSLAMPAARITDDEVIPFEGAVILRMRVLNADGSFSGGNIEFQGTRLLRPLDGQPAASLVTYQFAGPWYAIRNCPFQQPLKSYDNGTLEVVSTTVSEVSLFWDLATGTRVSTGAQLRAILQLVLDEYAAQGMAPPFVIGTIDPGVLVQTYQCKDIKCDEAIKNCMRTSPDGTIFFDYTTAIPTIHVRLRSQMAAANLAMANGVDHKSIKLTPRPDLQLRAVVLYFKETSEVNGVQMTAVSKQKWPADGPDGGLRVLVQTIDLQGGKRTDVFGSLLCAECLVNDSQANRTGFWTGYKPELGSSKVQLLNPGGIAPFSNATILDAETGEAVSLTDFPNVLQDGTVAEWMTLGDATPITTKKVKIKATVAYEEYADDDLEILLHRYTAKEIQVSVTLTNGVSGDYSALQSSSAGEDEPPGLAQSLYESMAQLQYEGNHVRVEASITTPVTMANVLNITNGRAEWAAMRAQIQGITKHYGSGQTTVRIGPAGHLSAADLTQLFLINRFRSVFYNNSIRGSGESNSGQVKLGRNTPKQDTTEGIKDKSVTSVSMDNGDGSRTVLQHDAGGKQIVMYVVQTDGTVKAAAGQLLMALAKLNGHKAEFYEDPFCAPDGTQVKAMVLRTEMY